VTPAFADVRGGTRVTVSGTNFAPTGAKLRCRFQSTDRALSQIVDGEWLPRGPGGRPAVVCTTPRVGVPGNASMLGLGGGAGVVSAGIAGVGEVRTYLQVTVDGIFAPLPSAASAADGDGDGLVVSTGRPGGGGVPFGFYDGSVPPLVSQLLPATGPCRDGGRWVANLAADAQPLAAASCASPHAAKR
jgi:hypothetical protein